MTERGEEAGAARAEKAHQVAQDFLSLARQATETAKGRKQTYVTERGEEAGAARAEKDKPE